MYNEHTIIDLDTLVGSIDLREDSLTISMDLCEMIVTMIEELHKYLQRQTPRGLSVLEDILQEMDEL